MNSNNGNQGMRHPQEDCDGRNLINRMTTFFSFFFAVGRPHIVVVDVADDFIHSLGTTGGLDPASGWAGPTAKAFE